MTEPGGKEVSQRFDFKNRNTDAKIAWSAGRSRCTVSEERVKAVLDVPVEAGPTRVSPRRLDAGRAALLRRAGEDHRHHQGGDHRGRKKDFKLIRDEVPAGVKAQIQGDEPAPSESRTTCSDGGS